MSQSTKPFGTLRSIGGRIRAPFEGPNTTGNSTAFWVVFLGAVGFLMMYPQMVNPLVLGDTTRYFALGFLALSLCLVWGFGGILSFGQVAFFGVAGYAWGIISINFASATGMTLGIVGAVFIGTLFSFILGYFMFYGGVRDVYVTIITLVSALVLHTFMAQTAGSQWVIGSARLGGFNGMHSEHFELGIGSTGIVFGGTSPDPILRYYYFVVALLIVTYLALRVLVNSSFGMTMVAIREDEDRTATFGYNVPFVKLVIFTIGGALASLGGVLYTAWGSYISPSVFAITFAALPVVWVSIGGRESLIGVVGATVAIEWMQDSLAGTGSEWAMVIVGGLLVFVILVMPAGVAPQIERAGKWLLEKLPPHSDQQAGEPTSKQTRGDD